MKSENVTIIGAGPAGIATAIQLKRWGIDPVILEKNHIGGLLLNANLVENYPGFPNGISGPDLVKLCKSQMERIGIDVSFEELMELDYDKNFILHTSAKEFTSRIVVIATGTQPKPYEGIEIPKNAKARIYYEVYPLTNLTGKKIAIIGAGDAAFDYALNLSHENVVTILNRGTQRKCLPLLWDRTQQKDNITYHENTSLTAIKLSEDALTLRCKNTQGDWELGTDYVIFAIGRISKMDFFSARLTTQIPKLEEEGKLYFAGDVKNDIFRQTSIAVGDGIRVAMKICQLIGEIR